MQVPQTSSLEPTLGSASQETANSVDVRFFDSLVFKKIMLMKSILF